MTHQLLQDYPHLRSAVLDVAYDNGGIFIYRTEDAYLEDASPVVHSMGDEADFATADAWLKALTEDELMMFTGGEREEMEALVARAPQREGGCFVNDLLNRLFEEVV